MTRRLNWLSFSSALTLCAALLCAVSSQAFSDALEIGFVSRERVLNEADIARQLRAAETELTVALQSSIDDAKALLAAEPVSEPELET